MGKASRRKKERRLLVSSGKISADEARRIKAVRKLAVLMKRSDYMYIDGRPVRMMKNGKLTDLGKAYLRQATNEDRNTANESGRTVDERNSRQALGNEGSV